MMRNWKCGAVALVLAACGLDPGDGAHSREAVRGPRISQLAELRDPVEGGHGGFGRMLRLAEGTLVVGEPAGWAFESGHVHVFGNAGSRWVHEAELTPPPGRFWTGDVFAAGPGVVAVPSVGVGPGVVSVFERGRNGWAVAGELPTPPEAAHFGLGIALSADRMLVSGDADGWPAVWSFTRAAAGWTLDGAIPSPFRAGRSFDGWGFEVALSGGRAAISDPSYDEATGFRGGVAVYDDVGGAWQLASAIEEPAAEPNFGSRLAFAGGTLAVSIAHGTAAHLWNVAGATAVEEAEFLENAAGPSYGFEVGVGDGFIAVAASGCPGATVSEAGAVYVYLRTDTGWAAPIELRSGEEVGEYEYFGSRIAVSGSLIAVSAPGAEEAGDEEGYGEVYLFELKRGGR